MTTEAQNLSPEQNELVAVGASIGAGCQPCVAHHLKAGAKAGLDPERLLAAVTSAEHVTAQAAVAIGDHARRKLGPSVTAPTLLSRLEEALASFGAALGANDAENIERQLRAAVELGASRAQLQQAIETAHAVQQNAGRIHLREAERLLDAVAPAAAVENECVSGEGRGGRTDAEPEVASPAAKAPEPADVTSGREAGCGNSMAGFFSAASASVASADCRQMFERWMPDVTPAKTDEAPATTVAGRLMQEGGLTMTTIAAINLPVNSNERERSQR